MALEILKQRGFRFVVVQLDADRQHVRTFGRYPTRAMAERRVAQLTTSRRSERGTE